MTSFYIPEKLSTKDGSDTLVHSELGELYHSRHGALTESNHVFIQNGLKYYISKYPKKESIAILEMGLGSGLNAVLSQEITEKYKINVEYTGIEMYPVDYSIIENMQFGGLEIKSVNLLHKLHNTPWGTLQNISSYFSIEKIQGSFLDHIRFEAYDLIYYDAFAPNAQPELWDENALHHCYQLLETSGIWVSYCAKGSVKRGLKNAGFEVTALPGPPFKREMTRAEKVYQKVAVLLKKLATNARMPLPVGNGSVMEIAKRFIREFVASSNRIIRIQVTTLPLLSFLRIPVSH